MRAAFYTLGCKVNQYETAALQRQFSEDGYEIVDWDSGADVYVVNSCTVTAESDRKCRQLLRRIRRSNPSALICLCGCFPQAFPESAGSIAEADIIMGSKDRSRLLAAVNETLLNGGRTIDITPHTPDEKLEGLTVGKFYSRTRAFVKIEDGCQRYCAYCIIPTARGPVRSKPLAELRGELEGLVAEGYAEVVLAGINLSCYGQDMGLRLIDAVKLACDVEGIVRVRLSSLEPELLTRKDIEEMARLPKLCPEFHLSLQSGCDATLERMRRMYTSAEYRAIAGNLRGAFKDCALTTDIMVGFPEETDEEFSQSLEFCRDMGFARAHVFAYSPREGTSAAGMSGQIPVHIKRERSRVMIEVMNESRGEFLSGMLNKPVNVLFETKRPDGRWEGYSENYTPVLMDCRDDLSGKLLTVTPTGVEGEYCTV